MDAIKEPFPFVTKRKVAAPLNHLVLSLRKITPYIIDKECLPKNNDLGFSCLVKFTKFCFFYLKNVLVLDWIKFNPLKNFKQLLLIWDSFGLLKKGPKCVKNSEIKAL